MREHMADLVTQRNDLIHKMLPRLDLESEDKCAALGVQLDQQAETVRNSIKHFQSVHKGIQEVLSDMVSFLQTEEGRNALFPEGD